MVRIRGQTLPRVARLGRTVPFLACRAVTVTWYTTAGHPGTSRAQPSPQLRQVVGEGRRATVCFDRGGWSPALFAGITAAGFDLLTWRMGSSPDVPADAFTTITCADDRGRKHEYDLADTTITVTISEGSRKGRRSPCGRSPAACPPGTAASGRSTLSPHAPTWPPGKSAGG